MTTEQREAIDRLKDDIKYADMRDTVDDDCTICFIDDLDTALSLIKEQQEEIEGLKDKEVLIKRYFKKCDLIKQKDKQIDLMAFNLADYVMYYEYDKCRNPEMIKNKAEELKQYFERKVEDEK